MSNVVELLEKLIKPKSLNLCGGGSDNFLRKEELYAALNVAVSKHAFGLNALLMTQFSDLSATNHVAKILLRHAEDQGISFHEIKVSIAVCTVAKIPLEVQVKKIKSLHKRYGPRSFRSRKLITTWKKRIDSLERSGGHFHLIQKHRDDIKLEEKSLDSWAMKQAKTSTICPRCKGTGKASSKSCSSCDGLGRFSPSMQEMKQEIISRGISESELGLTWYAEIINLMNIIQIAQGEVVQEMKLRYELESI